MQILKTSALKESLELAVWNMFSSVSSTFGVQSGQGSGCRVHGVRFRGFRCTVQGCGCRVQGVGLRGH